jgi:hypothetical protein
MLRPQTLPFQTIPKLTAEQIWMSYEMFTHVHKAVAINKSEVQDDKWLQEQITEWTILNRQRLEFVEDEHFYAIYALGLELVLLHENPQPLDIN